MFLSTYEKQLDGKRRLLIPNDFRTAENGAAPTHCAPSPPIWLKVEVFSSGWASAITWQPMPPPVTEPSGVLVEVLCGQPEQK